VRLLDALAEAPPDDLDLTLFVNSSLLDVADYAPLVDHFTTAVAPVSGARKVGRVLTDATWLGREARQRRVRVMHHAGGTIPIGSRGPSLLTVHDLQPLAMPGYFRRAKRLYLGYMMPRSVRRATRIATLTEFVAHDVQQRLHVPPSHFVRVPPGLKPAPPTSPVEVAEVRDRYDLVDETGAARPFFLYPAITYPHKNHVTLLHAFAEVHRAHPETVLVLTGGAAQEEARVASTIDRLGLRRVVRRTGRIPARHLEVLYRNATALTFVSRYEGCGNPVLEAMAADCPVIASDCTGLIETVGAAGLLVGPMDVDGWAAAMDLVLTDGACHDSLVTSGRTSVGRYDWATSARALAAAYREVAEAS
jgi:glycosyltransferase involved in cell wall biosynthesis